MKQKTFFIIFKSLSVAKNCLRPEGAHLKQGYTLIFANFLPALAIY